MPHRRKLKPASVEAPAGFRIYATLTKGNSVDQDHSHFPGAVNPSRGIVALSPALPR